MLADLEVDDGFHFLIGAGDEAPERLKLSMFEKLEGDHLFDLCMSRESWAHFHKRLGEVLEDGPPSMSPDEAKASASSAPAATAISTARSQM